MMPHSSPAFARGTEATELKAWRLLGAEVSPLLCRILAAQGEPPDPQVLKLQHALAELLAVSRPATPFDSQTSKHVNEDETDR